MLNILHTAAIVALLFGSLGFAEAQQTVGLDQLFVQYQADARQLKKDVESHALPSGGVADFNAKWADIFRKRLAAASSDDKGYRQILSELLALDQSVGNYGEAEKLNQLLLQGVRSDVEKFSLISNLAETDYGRYLTKSDQIDPSKLTGYFEEAMQLIQEPSIPVPSRLDLLIKYATFNKQNKDFNKAAAVYANGIQILDHTDLSSLTALQEQSRTRFSASPFSKEWFLSSMIDCELQAGQKDSADLHAKQLFEMKDLWLPESEYFYQFQGYKDPSYGRSFQQDAEKWLSNAPKDRWTDYLKFYLARSYLENQNFPSAYRLYKELLGTDLAQPSKQSLGQGEGGTSAEIMYNLALCLHQLGNDGQANILFKSFGKMFPNDPRSHSVLIK